MADNNSITKTDIQTFSNSARDNLALSATYEIEALSKLIVDRASSMDEKTEDVYSEGLVLKGLAMRIKQLNSVIMEVMSSPPPEDSFDFRVLKKKIG